MLLGVVLSLTKCVEPRSTYAKLPPGIWRGVLYLSEAPPVVTDKDEISYKTDFTGELPFNFEVIYTDDTTFYIEIHNAEERIRIDNVTFGRTKAEAKDTTGIHFTEYDTYISAYYEENILEGFWHVNYVDGYKIKFKAFYGDNARFKLGNNPASTDYTGRWAAMFEPGTESEYPAVADFVQKDSKITGTFTTETGDFRYLEGSVYGQKAFLSCFDGAHAFLFEAKMLADSSITGQFRSKTTYTAPWEAKKSSQAKLANAYELSKASTDKPISFTYTNDKGKMISIEDDKYKGKAKLIAIMGTWCPNCKDEANFLKEYIQNNKNSDLEIISLAFERYRDSTLVLNQLSKYKEKMDIPWEVLAAGYYDKKEATQSFSYLDKISSYPTLLYLDKNNVVKYVYTGFYGPATKEYEDFKLNFDKKIKEITK